MLDAKSRALDYYSSVSAGTCQKICCHVDLFGVASKLSSDWSYEDYANAFSADMESLIAQKRSEELKKVTVLLQVCLHAYFVCSYIYPQHPFIEIGSV